MDLFNHFGFWAGLAFLAALEITALILNMLPIPGLAGFGILAPFLPKRRLASVRGFGPYTLVIMFILFTNEAFNRVLWTLVRSVTLILHIDGYLIYEGFRLFQFWKS